MEEVISYPPLMKPTNLENFVQDLRPRNRNSSLKFASHLSKKTCRAEISEKSEETSKSDWIKINNNFSAGITGSLALPKAKRGTLHVKSSLTNELSSLSKEAKCDVDVNDIGRREENLFSHSESVLLADKAEDEEAILLFESHLKNNELKIQIRENKETQILRKTSSNDGGGHLTYQSVLPLVLDNFQSTKNDETQEPSTRDLQTLSFQQLLAAQNNQDTDSTLDQVLVLKPPSQLPPISDFQVSMKLNDETDNNTSMMEEANQTGSLFGDLFPEPILVEPLNMSELDGSQATWSLENLFNLSLSVPNSTDDIYSLNKNKVFNSTSHHGVYSDLFQTFVLPSSVGRVASSSEQCSNPSLLSSSSQLFSDPMIQPIRDDEKQVSQGDATTSYTAWNQLGIFLDGVQTLTNDDSGWFGNYVTSLECDMEHKKDSEAFDGNDEWLPNNSARKCSKANNTTAVHPIFASMSEVDGGQKVSKQLVGRNGLNLKSNGGILYHAEKPSQDSKPLVFGQLLDHQRVKTNSCLNEPRKSKRSICLWQFLKELLLYPEAYQSWIRWIDKNKGVFKIEDSVSVARLWGQRKNKPAMNYDKLSRSIRQYYKKGIIKKTSSSKRLVYQFCPQYLG